MNEMHTNLKGRVMKRVFGFWFLRSMIPLLFVELAGLAVALYLIARAVFVGAVVNNALAAALGNPFRFIQYFWNAFLGAGLGVQIFLIILLAAFVFMLRDVNRSLISYAITRRSEFTRAGGSKPGI